MPLFGKEIKPISIAAFILNCLGSLLAVIAISLTDWWSADIRTYGVWSLQICKKSGSCETGSATQLEGGQEALFVSRVFATFTVFLSVMAVVSHVIYAILSRPFFRTAVIFMLGSAALFGLLSIFVFLGFYNSLEVDMTSIGAAFYVFLLATLICAAAAAFTTWASVRKATEFRLPHAEDS